MDFHKVTDDTEDDDDELFTLEITLDDFELTTELEDFELLKTELADLELTTKIEDELELGALLEITLEDATTEDLLEDAMPSQEPRRVHSCHWPELVTGL